jgi:hypothetical protein
VVSSKEASAIRMKSGLTRSHAISVGCINMAKHVRAMELTTFVASTWQSLSGQWSLQRPLLNVE